MSAAGLGGGVPRSCSVEELRTLFLFEKLDEEQLNWLCEHGTVEAFEPGQVYAEGEAAQWFYVLLEGTVVLSRRVGADDVEVTRTSQVGVYSGAFQAYLGDRVQQIYRNSLSVTVPSRFFVVSAELFSTLMHEWFPMAVHLLEGLFFGTQIQQQIVGGRERLLALGALSAGLTHELNNPAGAALRAASALREGVVGARADLGAIAAHGERAPSLAALVAVLDRATEAAARGKASVSGLGPLAISDREDAMADWLDDRGVENGWQLAPTFVQAGLEAEDLDRITGGVDGGSGGGVDDGLDDGVLPAVLSWLARTLETEGLTAEIEEATHRVSDLVGAAKQYSQLDRASQQEVDVHELLDSTVTMLAGKIPAEVRVVKDYGTGLPKVPAYPAELNQVWTNLIDNAVAAMADGGTLTISTSLDREHLVVEFRDTGPGVPDEIKGRIFEPFFTTKPVGKGTGLGLDISWRIVVSRHHGDLSVESVPGDTRFRVRLPLRWNGDGESGS
ncbi:signal transduction histidine kinase [Catenulispora sp. EB89]|uniref:ATP-binding protein n=1 Tax=Catenulispora sp. EB89 TaxID=3156257 RepID=UPI00351615D9